MDSIYIPRNITLILRDIYEAKKCKFTAHIIKLIKIFCYALSVWKGQPIIKVFMENIDYKECQSYRYRMHNLKTFLNTNSEIEKVLQNYFYIEFGHGCAFVHLNVNKKDFYSGGKYPIAFEDFKKIKNFYDLLKAFTISKKDVFNVLRQIGVNYSDKSIYTIFSRINKSPIKFRPYIFKAPTPIFSKIASNVKYISFIKEKKSITKLLLYIIHLKYKNKLSKKYFTDKEINLIKAFCEKKLILLDGHIQFLPPFFIKVSEHVLSYWNSKLLMEDFVYIEISRGES